MESLEQEKTPERIEYENAVFNENYSPLNLVMYFDEKYPNIYNQDAGVWEGYTIGQHTVFVLTQFEKYFSFRELPADIHVNTFRTILALHDVGKHDAILEGDKNLQHKYTKEYVREFFKEQHFSKKETDLAIELVSGDSLGKYLRGMVPKEQILKEVLGSAERTGISPLEYFDLLTIFFRVDAGSYTEDAGALKSLDEKFVFDHKNRCLGFSSLTIDKVEELRAVFLEKV
ncbi:MAG TPA: hypothetical protein VJY47_03150 [Candidatus Dojkabacteria bacterium]|nr:hypothetical protein [Candidatus Dojkabacteria bacterium]